MKRREVEDALSWYDRFLCVDVPGTEPEERKERMMFEAIVIANAVLPAHLFAPLFHKCYLKRSYEEMKQDGFRNPAIRVMEALRVLKRRSRRLLRKIGGSHV